MGSTRVLSFVQTAALASAILASTLLAACSQAPKQTLRLILTPGKTYALSVRTTADAVLTGQDGNSFPLPSQSVHTFSLQAGDLDEHGETFASVEVGDTEFPMVFIPLGVIFKEYSFGIKLSPVGRISEFVNTDAMRAGILQSLSAYGTGATIYGSTPPNVAIAYISDDALRAIIEPITGIWPEAPVSPGDEWSGPETYLPAAHTLSTARYRLESWDDSEAKIRVDTVIRPAGDRVRDPNLPAGGVYNGKGTGEIIVDPLLGTIRSYELDQEISGTINSDGKAELKVSITSRTQAELTAR